MNQAAEQLKFTGLELAASKYGPDLERAHMVAERLAMDGSAITSDDVRDEFFKHYQRPLDIGNALPKLFIWGDWEFVDRVKSRRKEAHGRFICRWRLRKPEPARKTGNFDVGIENGVRFCTICSHETEHCVCQLNGSH